MRKILLLLLVAFGTSLAIPAQAALFDYGATVDQQQPLPDGIADAPYVNPSGTSLKKALDKSKQNCWSLDTRMPCYVLTSLSRALSPQSEFP